MKRSISAFLPELNQIIVAKEGTGDNLLDEDMAQGYKDYVYIDTYIFDGEDIEQYDGGQIMLTEWFTDVYANDDDGTILLDDAIEFMYGSKETKRIIIENTKED